MTDSLLTVSDQQEALSRAYVQAVAGRAGYITAYPDFDRSGVDLTVHANGGMSPALGVQLKATTNLGAPSDGCFRFPLKSRNYNQLCKVVQTPRILVVLDLPKNKREWMTITEHELVLRRRAYWLSLKGSEKTDNRRSVTVGIPSANVFDVDGLRGLMDQSRKGGVE